MGYALDAKNQMQTAQQDGMIDDVDYRMLPTDPEGSRQQDCNDQRHEEYQTALEGYSSFDGFTLKMGKLRLGKY